MHCTNHNTDILHNDTRAKYNSQFDDRKNVKINLKTPHDTTPKIKHKTPRCTNFTRIQNAHSSQPTLARKRTTQCCRVAGRKFGVKYKRGGTASRARCRINFLVANEPAIFWIYLFTLWYCYFSCFHLNNVSFEGESIFSVVFNFRI